MGVSRDFPAASLASMNETDPDALETRASLPEALRVLAKEYPREAWEADANFSGLIRFWIDRHLMFRRIVGTMQDETRRMLDREMEPRLWASHLSRYGSMLIGELHGHHSIEDMHYFPVLKELDARVARGFDILDRDHHAIDAHLGAFAEAANGSLGPISRGEEAIDEAAAFGEQLARVERFLDRHLVDEEELVVPVLLRYTPAGLI